MERLLLSLLMLLLATATCAAVPAPKPCKPDALVGAFYYPGWSEDHRWHCIIASDTAQHPLLGYYREGDPEAADWHTKWALEHGVSFFAFDYYTSGGGQMLEAALDDGFLKSRHIKEFRFCLNWCNHAPWTDMTAEELRRFGDLVISKYLKYPSYLRIEGKPVVMILCGCSFVKNLGVDGAKAEFAKFEDRCKQAGLDGVYLVFCEGEIGGVEDIRKAFNVGADALCLYNYPYSGTGINGPGKHAEFAYTHLMEQGELLWTTWKAMTNGRFWPTVMPGWDRRPWTKYDDVVITGGTPDLFGQSLKATRDYLSKDRVVMIEAWNEWGEGSVLEPSVEHGFAYLDQVRRVFCPHAEPHKDATPPAPRKLTLPSVDSWRFDFDVMGWTVTGGKDLKQHWGTISFVTTTNDPQLTSPINYLDCARYRAVRVRMRVSGVTFAGIEATGQLFWSTTERGLCGEQSAQFPVKVDGEWHEYDVALPWRGRSDRVRLDPVDVEGVRVDIDEVRGLQIDD